MDQAAPEAQAGEALSWRTLLTFTVANLFETGQRQGAHAFRDCC
jgi:hypothetical protein